MKIKTFQITDFKCIDDSGEIPIDNLVVLVGKNESGKTSILKALYKFNPSTNESYDEFKEYPRKKFDTFDNDRIVTNILFELDVDERKQLERIYPIFSSISSVRVKKDYSGKHHVEFEDVSLIKNNYRDMLAKLKEVYEIIQANQKKDINLELNSIFIKLSNLYIEIKQNYKYNTIMTDENKLQMKTFLNSLSTSMTFLIKSLSQTNDQENSINNYLLMKQELSSQLPIISTMIEELNYDPFIKARQYIIENLPLFIYFENYEIIDSRIHLPSFVTKIKDDSFKPSERTAMTLFDMVNLDPEEIFKLGLKGNLSSPRFQTNLDKRSFLVNKASLRMTGDLVDLWKQRENKVEFDIDGNYLRLRVTDDVDGSKIELEDRSKGFQWFFSFYVIFNVESEKGYKNAILLLDEPGLHLHASAQADLLKVFKELSKKNQLIFTTHSPFMIDLDNLNSVRTVSESKNGSVISQEAWTTDKDALFPLQAALGYSMSQSLFIGKYNLVVEGITDFWYLSALSNLSKEASSEDIDDSIVITPAGGAHKAVLLTAMLAGQKLRVCVLLDSDTEGTRAANDIIKNKIIKDSKVIVLSEILGDKKEADFEDIFPEEFFIKYVNEAYEKELKGNIIECPIPGYKPRMCSKIHDIFEERGIPYHKTRPARLILDYLKDAKLEDLPQEIVNNFTSLAQLINNKLLSN